MTTRHKKRGGKKAKTPSAFLNSKQQQNNTTQVETVAFMSVFIPADARLFLEVDSRLILMMNRFERVCWAKLDNVI